jgi:transposase
MIAEVEMISVKKREQIRRAYFNENKSLRKIARELHCSRETVKKAIASSDAGQYTLTEPRAAPVLGPYKARIDELLKESERMPRKQRYTGHKIYKIIEGEGYSGSESGVRRYVGQRRRDKRRPKVYLPLEFDPGADAQVDWGEAMVIIAGERVTVQIFVMRLNYSRRLFVMAFPTQKQESFFEGHRQAFHFFEGVPYRISYDNLKAAVLRILKGRNREEQSTFIAFRSHYLFDSHFCTPGKGHEKGGVEHAVGYGRRNFMVPIPKIDSFKELNELLRARCQADDERVVDGQERPIGEMWAEERPSLRPLPERDFKCCVTRVVTLNGYSQVVFETNRYSVPTDKARKNLVLKAYPFRIDILDPQEVIASHPRCYGHKQDVLNPFHYLPLLEERPGAFDYAKPIRRWREKWPPVYEVLLSRLREQWPEGRGVREFIRVLNLHRQHPAELVQQAVEQAIAYGSVHADGVELCLHQLTAPDTVVLSLDLSDHPQLGVVGAESPDLACYDRLLEGSA